MPLTAHTRLQSRNRHSFPHYCLQPAPEQNTRCTHELFFFPHTGLEKGSYSVRRSRSCDSSLRGEGTPLDTSQVYPFPPWPTMDTAVLLGKGPVSTTWSSDLPELPANRIVPIDIISLLPTSQGSPGLLQSSMCRPHFYVKGGLNCRRHESSKARLTFFPYLYPIFSLEKMSQCCATPGYARPHFLRRASS